MLKVAIDIRDLRIAKTGARTYLEELIIAFKNMNDPEVQFFYFDTFLPIYTGKNKFLKIIEHLRFMLWKQVFLPFRAYFNGCDVVFCSDFFVPYLHLGFKTIPVLHDAFFFEYPQHYNKIWLFLFRTLGISSAKRAYKIITPTLYTKNTISKLSGLDSEQIIAIYEGPKTLTDVPDLENEELAIFSQRYLLHVGTMEIRKNIVNLLKGFKMLLEDEPDLKLVLIGQFSPKTDMDDRREIQNFIQEHQLEQQVLFPGYVADNLLADYYKHALLYVFPSYNEGFGIPILEAFSQKLPVVIANNSCLPEVGGDAVVSFDPYQAEDIYMTIKRLLSDPEKRSDMISKGTKRLELFSWENAAIALMKIFKESKTEKKQ